MYTINITYYKKCYYYMPELLTGNCNRQICKVIHQMATESYRAVKQYKGTGFH